MGTLLSPRCAPQERARRRAAGERSPRAQPIAANVDQSWSSRRLGAGAEPRMLDRFLVIAAATDSAVLVLNRSTSTAARSTLCSGATVRLATTCSAPRSHSRGLVALRISCAVGVVLAGQSASGNPAPERARPGLEPPHRRNQREVGHGQAHDRAGARRAGRTGAMSWTRRLARGGHVGDRSRALGRLFRRIPAFPRPMPLRHCRHLAEPGCGVREAAARGAFDPIVSFLPADLREVSVPSWSSERRRGR